MALSIVASSQNSSTTGTAGSVAAPTGTTTGDLVIIGAAWNGQTTIADNNGATPFTEPINDYKPNTSSGHVVSIFYRVIQAGDPTTYNFTGGASGRWSLIAVTVRGQHADLFDVAPSTANAQNVDSPPGSGSVVCPTINTLTNNALHFVWAFIDASIDDFDVWPAEYTVHQSVDNNQGQSVATKVIASPGATGAQTFEHNGSGTAYIGISFAVKEAVVASPTRINAYMTTNTSFWGQ
jgi:hypothetical protein